MGKDFNGPTRIHYVLPLVCVVAAMQFEGFTAGLLNFTAGMACCLLIAWHCGWRKTNITKKETSE